MSVKLTNFINIDINNFESYQHSGTRDTAVLFNFMEVLGTEKTITYSSMPDDLGVGDLNDFLSVFFANNGKKIKVIPVVYTPAAVAEPESFTTDELTDVSFKTLIEFLPIEEIVIGSITSVGAGIVEKTFRAFVKNYTASAGIYEKIFVQSVPFTAIDDIVSDEISIENYVIKLGEPCITATILAYYTKIDVYRNNTCEDYAFTTEIIPTGITEKNNVTDDNDMVVKVIENHFNTDTNLANTIRNIGGNDTAGYSLTNQFMLIALQQTLTYKLYEVLSNKIKYNSSGLKIMLNVISQELNNYVSNGFIATDKLWTNPDLYYRDYLIINQDTPLVNGYKVCILPFSSLSEADKIDRKLPDIYILVADNYFIRKVTISGNVF